MPSSDTGGATDEFRGELLFEDSNGPCAGNKGVAYGVSGLGLAVGFYFLNELISFSLRKNTYRVLTPIGFAVLFAFLMYIIGLFVYLAIWGRLQDTFRVYSRGIALTRKRRVPGIGWSSFVPAEEITRIDMRALGEANIESHIEIFTRRVRDSGETENVVHSLAGKVSDAGGAAVALAKAFPSKVTPALVTYAQIMEARKVEHPISSRNPLPPGSLFSYGKKRIRITLPGLQVMLVRKDEIRRTEFVQDGFGGHGEILTDDGRKVVLPAIQYEFLTGERLPRWAGKVRGRRKDPTLPVIFGTMTVVFLLMAGDMAGILTHYREFPPTDRESGRLVWLDVTGNKTIEGKDLAIFGDLVVERGATLNITGCNLTMFGDFQVYGTLNLKNTTLRDPPSIWGDEMNRSGTLLPVDLTGCGRATLDFRMLLLLTEGDSLRVEAFAGGKPKGELLRMGKCPYGIYNKTLDLSRYCGQNISLRFTLEYDHHYFASFVLGDAWLRTDLGSRMLTEIETGEEDSSWMNAPGPRYFPYSFDVVRGRLALEGCRLTEDSNHEYLFSIYESSLDIRNTEILCNRSWRYGEVFLSARMADVALTGVTLDKGWGMEVLNTTLDIRDCDFRYGSTAVKCDDSNLRFINSTVSGYDHGLRAMTTGYAPARSAMVEDSTIKAAETAVVLQGLWASVLRCDLEARWPLVVGPPPSLTRDNCTMENIAAIRGNTIRARSDFPPVMLASALPVSGMEAVMLNNTLGGGMQVGRYLPISFSAVDPDGNRTNPLLQHMKEYGYRDLDNDLRTLGNGTATDGWERLEDSLPPLRRINKIVEMESYQRTAGGWRYRYHEGEPRFEASSYKGMAAAALNTSVLGRSDEKVELRIALERACDLRPTQCRIGEGGPTGIGMAVYVERRGLQYNLSVLATCSWKGREFWRLQKNITSDFYSYTEHYSVPLDEELLNSSGELSFEVSAVGVREWNPTDNRLSAQVRVFNESANVSDEAAVMQLWLLARGVDLKLENCTLAGGADTVLYRTLKGWGDNRLTVRNCTVEATNLTMNVTSCRLENTELILEDDARFVGGDWAIDNVTLGCDRESFDERLQNRMDTLAAAGINESNYPYEVWRLLGRPDVALDFRVDNLALKQSRSITSIVAYVEDTFELSSSTVGTVRTFIVEAGNLSLTDNRLVAMPHVQIRGDGRTDFTRNDVKWVPNGISIWASNWTVADNVFLDPGIGDLKTRAISLGGPSLALLLNNSFSGYDTAVYYGGNNLSTAAVDANRFQDIHGFLALEHRSLTLNVSEEWVTSRLNATVSAINLSFPDLEGRKTGNLYPAYDYVYYKRLGYYFYYGGFVSCAIYPDGSIKRLSELVCEFEIAYEDGRKFSFERTYLVPAEEGISATIG